MKQTILLLLSALCLAGCSRGKTPDADSASPEPLTAVTLTQGRYGHIDQTVSYPATTVYRRKSVVAAPVAGYLVDTYVEIGTRVKAGQLLYRLESKEQHALGDGSLTIRAERAGIVLSAPQQAGDYVTEGTTLCTLADAGSLVFEVSVPYEGRRQVSRGSRFTLELPDGTRLPATVEQTLATMDADTQAEQVTARAAAPFLPEGLNVKALFPVRRAGGRGLLLPKGAVQSDETLTDHWVMKLRADSTVTRVAVEVTASDTAQVEVRADALTPQDRVVLTGGYGLEDGARVVINQ